MRVLHVIPGVAPRDGGPSVAIHAMARGVAALGADVAVATTNADGDGELPVPVDRDVIEASVTYRYFRRSLNGDWKFSLPLTAWLRDNVRRFDVVHVHALFSYATIPSCRLAAHAGVPFILRPLGTLDPWSLRQKRWKKTPYLRFVERRHLADAAAVHVTSAQEADAVAALGFGGKARLIPLGAELAPERGAPRTARPLRVLYLSRIHEKKGLPLLLDAVARLRRAYPDAVELVVAGRGAPDYEREMHAACDTLGITRAVRFVGHVDGAAKARTFDEADVFVLPSHTENFGIAVAEAMAAGLPVVVSDQVGLAESIQSADAGVVVPRDPAAISGALERLMRDWEERERLGRNARALIADRFSWTRTSEALLALYRELTTARAGAIA